MVCLAGAALAGCAAPAVREPAPPSAERAWVEAACGPESPDSRDWPRYRLGTLSIAVPREYRVSHGVPYTLVFSSRSAVLRLYLHRNATYEFDATNRPRPGQVWCHASYSGFPTEVLAWYADRRLFTVARWQPAWGGYDDGKSLYAVLSSSRLADVVRLRQALHTIQVVADSGR